MVTTLDDLLLIHWNGAVLFDPQIDHNIIHSIEFALCQLLELRYYDNLLDQQLEQLYHRIEHSGRTILTNPYRELCRKAALEYIDISEIVDRVGNAIKVIGDNHDNFIAEVAEIVCRFDENFAANKKFITNINDNLRMGCYMQHINVK